MKKGQVAAEYVIIVGFSIVALLIILVIYGMNSGQMQDKAAAAQAQQVARKIADAAESVYYLGAPSKTTLRVYIPANVKEITISTNEIIFNVSIKGQFSEIVQQTAVNLTGNITEPSGMKSITVTARENDVLIA